MGPIWMAVVILGLSAAFAVSASRRMALLLTGRAEIRWDRITDRLLGVWQYAFAQKKMAYYPTAGLAHKAIFIAFLVLLLRTLTLWGRGFYAPFNMFVFGHEPLFGVLPLGEVYDLVKDVVASLCILGASTFIYFRAVKREARMTLSSEGLLILGIIVTMMLADMFYDGATFALASKLVGPAHCGGADVDTCEAMRAVVAPLPASEIGAPLVFHWYAPVGSMLSMALQGLSPKNLMIFAHTGFWTHSTLVLVFANILPHSKHFHIITAIPNVFARNIGAPGRLPLVAKSSEELGSMVEKAFENAPDARPVGVAKIEDFSWKAILDFYTCTECGRCSDNCPAHKTGKILSPKMLMLDLRDHLYSREDELIEEGARAKAHAHAGHAHAGHAHGEDAPETPEAAAGDQAPEEVKPPPMLIGDVIHPDVLWACTTCRACEEQCPVMISYVDKIVEMRRNLVLIKGEFPAQLNGPFGAMETNGNPWNLSRVDRGTWAEGLGVKTVAEHPEAEVLYWVGCAASYDDRAKKVARATAKLLQQAGVDFAILADEETCTGDPARRAGNEYLFMMLAEQNVATLNGYQEKGGIKKIITACPHCFNTLANEYPDFGAKFEVLHHTEFLLGLVAEKKLVPKTAVKGRVVYHDSCYLGRYNGVYEPPREILKRIPGLELVEAEGWNRNKGLCCGAGGAQMWMEEQNKDRVNVKRTLQLLDTGATTIASGCPFCQTMLTDGLKSQSKEEEIRQLDVAELLQESCLAEDAPKKKKGKAAATEPDSSDAKAS